MANAKDRVGQLASRSITKEARGRRGKPRLGTKAMWAKSGTISVALHTYADTGPTEWTNPKTGKVTIYDHPTYPDMPSLKLKVQYGKKTVAIPLDGFTTADVDAFAQFFTRLGEVMKDHSEELDARAQKEHDNGDDTNPRIYKQLPVFHERAGKVGGNTESV